MSGNYPKESFTTLSGGQDRSLKKCSYFLKKKLFEAILQNLAARRKMSWSLSFKTF
jgi:hypothetical protein